MDGVATYFKKGKFKELHALMRRFLAGEGAVTKIDGSPAIVMWSDFPELPSPGVSFKTIVKQAQRGNPKNVMSSMDDINQLAKEKNYDDEIIGRRIDAFKYALKHLAPKVKPGCMLWGDVLFTPYTKESSGSSVVCTPNTLTYEFDESSFPGVTHAEFGIYLHSLVDGEFNVSSISNVDEALLSHPSDNVFAIAPMDMQPKFGGDRQGFLARLEEINDMVIDIAPEFNEDIGKAIDKALRTGVDIADEIMSSCKGMDDDIDGKYAESVQDAFLAYMQLKEDIVQQCKPPVRTFSSGKPSIGEGYVIGDGHGNFLKLVPNEFTTSNIEHIRNKVKQKVNESVEGDYLTVWTSSKDSNLFNLYIKKMLTFGNSGGSNYGFASYAVIEPPFSDDAEIGYSSEFRAKIYGDNIFEFRVPTSKVLFLLFDEYKKTKLGRNAKFATFVRDQVKRMGLDFTDEEIQQITPESQDENTATQAMRLYKMCSRKYYQKKDGTLKSPFAGFVYKGRMDGRVYVGWNPYALEPVRMSKDAGKTWEDVDRTDPELVEYLKDETQNIDDDQKDMDELFDGNRTEEKEQVYRLLMKYNSNDGMDDRGQELRMSDGVFYNIVIHDDKTIDARYRSNLPIVDHYKHYYRPSQNQFIQQIVDMGYRFGHLDCGLKIGAETKDYPWDCYNVPDELIPLQVDGGLKLTAMKLDKPIDVGCKFGDKQLVLVKCELAKDVFQKFDVVLTKNEKKLNWTTTPKLKEELAKKYKWADSEFLLESMPEKTQKKKKTSRQITESSKQEEAVPIDSTKRVAVILTDGRDVIVGQALQHIGQQKNCCDLMKGHAQVGEDLDDAAKRETLEECGIHLANLEQISSDLQYTKKDTLRFYISVMNPLPDVKTLKCHSYFLDDRGRKIPEIVKFHKIPLNELETYVYRGISRLIGENDLIEEIKRRLNLVQEAKVKKDPSEQVSDYIKSLSRDQIQTLTLRCSELLDKWNEPQGSDTILRVRHVVDNDERFLKFLKKTVPLKEPATRDMGANTFVSHFFDPPFDNEAFIGNMAKEKGIPFTQAEEEWQRSNLDKTHIGRYAHMLADDAVNGRPPSKEGTNPKEIAVYNAIYDYAKKLVEGASNVESEVSLHAKSVTVGGKFDLLMKKGGQWVLVDWKTNGEELDDIPNGKVGLDELTKDINNNSYNKYALQLNVYEWAAKDSGKIPKDAIVSKELHHFQYLEDGKPVKIRVVKVPDLQPLVQAMVDRAMKIGVVTKKQ